MGDRGFASLLVVAGNRADLGRHFTCRESTTIGTANSVDLRLADTSLAPEHARIDHLSATGQYLLVTLERTARTLVNGSPANATVAIEAGDKIFLGDTVLRFDFADTIDIQFQDRLMALVATDDTTGLCTAREYATRYPELLSEATKSGCAVSLVIIDLDGLKRTNDAYGHAAGTAMIKAAAEVIREGFSGRDLVCRYGGDEFLVCMMGVDGDRAYEIADNVRDALTRRTVDAQGKSLALSASFGIAVFPEDGATPTTLFAAADAALYRAKRLGRNRVVRHDARESRASSEVERIAITGDPRLIDATAVASLERMGFRALLQPSGSERIEVHALSMGSDLASAQADEARSLRVICAPSKQALDGSSPLARRPMIVATDYPIDPILLAFVLRRVLEPSATAVDVVGQARNSQTVEIKSSSLRPQYLASLERDLKAHRLRPQTIRTARAIADEMIVNALFHAPVDAEGRPLYAQRERALELNLQPAEEASLSWCVGDRFLMLRVRDPFGSIDFDRAMPLLLGTGDPRPPDARMGAGMGLRSIQQRCRHLVIAAAPGAFCDVVAFVETGHRSESPREGTLTVLRFAREDDVRLGARLRMVTQTAPNGVRLFLSGEIDETSDLTPVFGRSGSVILDLSGITAINSMGIMRWMTARSAYRDLAIEVENASAPVVAQCNLVAGFLCPHEVRSVLAPYYCSKCDGERLVPIGSGEVLRGGVPARMCQACGGALEFDDLPESFFGFLYRPRAPEHAR